MGLSFHYSARVKEYAQIPELVNEVIQFAADLNWHYVLIDHAKLKGIIVNAENCEPLWLCFLADGRTCSLENLKYRSPTDEFYSTIHVKTCFASAEVHKALIDLLSYLNNKYFSEVMVIDEGKYWETKDYALLISNFQVNQDVLDIMENILKNSKVRRGSANSLPERLQIILKNPTNKN